MNLAAPRTERSTPLSDPRPRVPAGLRGDPPGPRDPPRPRAPPAGDRPAHPVRLHPALAAPGLRPAERADLRAVALPAAAHQLAGAGGRWRPRSTIASKFVAPRPRQARLQPDQLRHRRDAARHRQRLGLARAVGQRGVLRVPDRLPRRAGGQPRGAQPTSPTPSSRSTRALLFGRALWLGEPLAIPLHRLESGALAALHLLHDLRSARRRPTRAPAACSSRRSSPSAPGTCSSGCSGPTACSGRSPSCSLAVPLIDRLLPGRALRLAPRPAAGCPEPPALDEGVRMKRSLARSSLAVARRLVAAAPPLARSAASTSRRPTPSCSTRPRRSCWCATATSTVLTMANDFKGDRRSSRSSFRCRRSSSASRSTSATRRSSITSTPTPRRGWSSTSTPIRARRYDGDAGADGRGSRRRSAARPTRARQEPRRDDRGAVHRRRVRHPDPLGASRARARDLAAARTATAFPPAPRAVLGSYIKQNMRFFVAKVNLERAGQARVHVPAAAAGRLRVAEVHAADPARHGERRTARRSCSSTR